MTLPSFTAEMEDSLDKIENGNETMLGVLNHFWKDFSQQLKLAEETIKHWLTGLNAFEREQVIDGIYSVLSASDGTNVSDLFEGRNIRAILKAVGNMDEETKEIITGAFKRLGSSLKETIPEWIDRAADEFRAMIAKKSKDREYKA